MHAGDIRPGDSKLEDALEKVRTTPAEAQKFASDPEGYLHANGVSTAGLRIGQSHGELTDSQLDSVAGGAAAVAPTICASVGAIVCVSVG